MRWFLIASGLVLLSAFAFGQATIIGGYAGNWQPSYGVYAAPFVPLVTTPSVSLGTYAASPAGASNATAGMVAGASAATINNVSVAPQATFTTPVWYGPTPSEFAAPEDRGERTRGRMHHEHVFDAGISVFQTDTGLAQLAGLSKPGGKASRTYTNDDLNRLNQDNGTVKYDGKTEKL